ncbi:Holliday junction resolvase RuvX [Desulfuribacillus alkaliarsenatis]|uniref:Putative pre-16S rRNA nuclease n=1 Tax=Desulfuribacillus alkaliarsenatis TaxID=766136 RepID=A0A1E5G0R0_9FIRM|nr:Holliday junction resolvase RuvX [Desulfuribacillus alkaliarsenatis]OEF96309.1 Holliday junction DNA helicase RuvA [Desulfuribacillus alkaliarsenatis]
MRIMGLDIGDKTIGVALSDEMLWTAQGLETIHRKKLADDLRRLQEIKEQYEVERIVAGLPKNMNGTLGPRAELVQELGTTIANELGIPVIYWDERLSTVAAERTLLAADVSRKKRKQVIDKMAAVIILQGYLDTQQAK